MRVAIPQYATRCYPRSRVQGSARGSTAPRLILSRILGVASVVRWPYAGDTRLVTPSAATDEAMPANGVGVWRNRIVDHPAEVQPAELVPNPRNWRSHPPEQQKALAGALAEVGWVAEVLVNRTTGNVVDGHSRIELALARDEPTGPVTYVELTDGEESLVLASLDPLAAMATAEREQLGAAGRARTC